MCNTTYSYFDIDAVYVAEGSDPKRQESGPLLLKLDENEIRAIRRSLEKITRRRIADAADAEDIVQDTLLAMITSNPKGELEKGVLAWSRGILRNKVGNYYRKSRRHEILGERIGGGSFAVTATPATATQEATLSNKEIRKIIESKIEGFAPEIRRVMELLISGFKAGEIAAHLHPEPYQSIINRLYRGRRKLVRELVKCGFGPPGEKNRNRKAG